MSSLSSSSSSSASAPPPPLTTNSGHGDGLVPGEEQAVRAWLVEQGFEPGDLRSAKSDYREVTPMAHACVEGQVNVCKWLYIHGAAEDISRANDLGFTPMLWACKNCHLSVCKWLFDMGADGDISSANNCGETPMIWACCNGHLSVCEWLYKVGADEDISRVDNWGNTPMRTAFEKNHLSVCEWLVLNGALNRPTSSTAAAEDEGDNDQAGHVDPAIVQRSTGKVDVFSQDHRPALLDWAKGVLATHHTFLTIVLRGSVILPDPHQQADDRCHLPRLARSDWFCIMSFLGVEKGRRLRNAREFAEALEQLPTGGHADWGWSQLY